MLLLTYDNGSISLFKLLANLGPIETKKLLNPLSNIFIAKTSFHNSSIFIMYFAAIINAKNAIMITDAECQHTSMISRSLNRYIGVYIIYNRCRMICNSCSSVNRWKAKTRRKYVVELLS